MKHVEAPFYSPEMLSLQRYFGTTALATQLNKTRVSRTLSPDQIQFVQSTTFLILATAGPDGQPDCSIKCGLPGFVSCSDGNTLTFPIYDGNGMFRSIGNIMSNQHVAVLLFELSGAKRKLRIHGTAEVTRTRPREGSGPATPLSVSITTTAVFPNCPRYLPSFNFLEHSEYCPTDGYIPPQPEWKRKEDLAPFVTSSPRSYASDHKQLNLHYLAHFRNPASVTDSAYSEAGARIIERKWLEEESGRVTAENLPTDVRTFTLWYAELQSRYNNALGPFFSFLAHRAPLECLAYYIDLEEQVDGRFDDVIALAQVGLEGDAKLALAENFWDELGRGTLSELHTVRFLESAAYMREVLSGAGIHRGHSVPDEALKNGNLLLAFALNRQHHLRLLGAISILESTAPARFAAVTQGLKRLKCPEKAVYYHELHIQLDENHGEDLLRRVMLPIVTANPGAIPELFLGAEMRLNVSRDYYARILQDFVEMGLCQMEGSV